MKDLITADDLAERLGITRNHVYRLARRGDCPSFRIGRYFRFDFDRVLEALDVQREEVPGPGEIGEIDGGQREV
jgi:excisionase family DNA binding protein